MVGKELKYSEITLQGTFRMQQYVYTQKYEIQ
jgi:hypothetical protein